MEAKDTRMSLGELVLIKAKHIKETGIVRPDIRAYVFAVIEKQAEITWDIAFNAGRASDIELIHDIYNRAYEKGREAGRKEKEGVG